MHSNKSRFYFLVAIVLVVSAFARGIGISFDKDVTLSLEQKQLLDKFKERVVTKLPEAYMRTEMNLIKWLRSSRFDIGVAESRILRDIEWRIEQRMDTIHSEDWSDIWSEDFHYYLEGRDNLARPFLFFDVKNMDVRKIVLQGKGDRLLRFTDKAYDEACTLVRNLGEQYGNLTRGHLLINLDGYNNIQHSCFRCIPFLLRMIFSYINHWPECVDKIILVNSPTSIHQFLEIARPLLDESLRNSIFVYGTNKKKWTKALEEDFDSNQLPPVLGGTKVYKGMDDFDEFDL